MTWDTSLISMDPCSIDDFVPIPWKVERAVMKLAKEGKREEARALARKLAPDAMYPGREDEHYLDRKIIWFSWTDPNSIP